MKEKASASSNDFLRKVLEQAGGKLSDNIADSLKNTIETMFGQKVYAAKARTVPDTQRIYTAVVTMTQGEASFRLRLAVDGNLIKTLVASSYPLEAANSDEILLDAVAEVANVVSARLNSFINDIEGCDVSRGLPVSAVEAGDVVAAGSLNLIYSIFRNNLSVRNLLTVSLL